MSRYVWKKLCNLIFQVFLVVSLMFVVFRLLPGDPAGLILGPGAAQAEVEQLRDTMGLNENIFTQYLVYLKKIFTGNMGFSYSYNQAVTTVLVSRIVPTLKLMLGSILTAAVIGVSAGVFSGVYPDSKASKFLLMLWVVILAIPNFWLGLLLIQFFAVTLGWLPAIGYGSFAAMILPVCAIAARLVALIARITRSSVMEVANEEYVRFAEAKGMRTYLVVLRHILRPALPPIVTMIGMQAGYLLGGSVVIENLFSYPGMGQLLLAAVSFRDYELMQGITFFFVFAFLGINLIVDLLYGQIDPRIRFE
ncbi:MAG: ABC transporter permease [Hungatella hathewayi]|nr:ABC transporter permease [Hungatella hathewayi]